MTEFTPIQNKHLMPVVLNILKEGRRVRLPVTGNSMFPVLRGCRDSVELISADKTSIRRGNTILVRREDGRYVLHRIVKVRSEGFYIAGDAQDKTEGPFSPIQAVALVSGVWRGSCYLSATCFQLRFFSFVWIMILPFRRTLLLPLRNFWSFIRRWF